MRRRQIRLVGASIVAVVAATIIAVEIWIGMTAQPSLGVLLTLTIISAGTALWTFVGLQTFLGRRVPRVVPPDVVATEEDRVAGRLDKIEALLRLLASEADLTEAKCVLDRAAEAVESWEDVATDVPRFLTAANDWIAILRAISPALVPANEDASPAELRAGREQLPSTRNFSSEELRTALLYIVHRERITTQKHVLQNYRTRLIAEAEPE